MRPQTQARHSFLLPLLCALLLPAQLALAVELAPNAPETYTVQPGDTLWSIAGRFLRDPWRWREVWRDNGSGNPDLIYPGDLLRLSTSGGTPTLSRDGDGGGTVVGHRGGMRVVKLSPGVRSESLKEAVPTIPIASVAPFLTQPFVAEVDELRRAPYVVGFPDEHIVAGVGDSIYVRRIDGTDQLRFEILRPGGAYTDPESNEILGYEAVFVANADLERVGDPAKLAIVRAEREVSIGDRVVPAELEEPLSNFHPRAAPWGMRGHILSVLNGVSQIGRFDVVVLNKGSKNGLERGHVLEVFRGGSTERDQVRQGGFDPNWKEEGFFSRDLWLGSNANIRSFRSDAPDASAPMPPHADLSFTRSTFIKPFERSGVLMVFRTFDRVSFALVLEASRPMHLEDRVAAPPH